MYMYMHVKIKCYMPCTIQEAHYVTATSECERVRVVYTRELVIDHGYYRLCNRYVVYNIHE